MAEGFLTSMAVGAVGDTLVVALVQAVRVVVQAAQVVQVVVQAVEVIELYL